MRPHFAAVLLLTILLFSCGLFQSQSSFPIVAWYGPESYSPTTKQFNLLRQAGFTHSLTPGGSYADHAQSLAAADSAGIKLILGDRRFDKIQPGNDSLLVVVDSVAMDYSDHPAFAGYFLSDKPGADEFAQLAKTKTRIAKTDSVHPVIVNLQPAYATPAQLDTLLYQDYLTAFISEFNPTLLWYEHFGLLENDLRTDYFYNLELARRISRDAGIPFYGSVLVTHFSPYSRQNMAQLRFQAFSALGYGAKGLHFFSYSKPFSRIWNYHEAIVDDEGNPTELYYLVQKLNRQIQTIAPILVGAESQGVYHSDPVPDSCSALIPGLSITKIDAQNIMAGFFKGYRKKEWVLLVNKNYHSGVLATVYLGDRVKKIAEMPLNDAPPQVQEWPSSQGEKTVRIIFKAGEGKLFQIYKSARII